MSLASYSMNQPRRFWLTPRGVEKAELLVGESEE
jgi:hypothetical protein